MASKAEICEIYVLSHPLTGEVRYVGKANKTSARLASHLRDARRRATPLYCWILSLAKIGLKPNATVICSTWAWESVETEIIASYRKDGARLLNMAPGGNQPLLTKEQASANGRKTAENLNAAPEKKRIWQMKRTLSTALAAGELSEFAKRCMRQAAKCNPRIFGEWMTA